jgi:bifunctional DNase/RNase
VSIKMDVKALIVDPIANMPVVILRDEGDVNLLPIWVGVFEANAIALQMEGVTTPRPMTHDLLKNLIEKVQGDVVRVVINNLLENTFYAQIHLRVADREFSIDSRPSDAIALALRAAAPVYVEESVLEKSRQAGEDSADGQNAARLRKWLEEVDPDSLGKYRM